MGSFHQVRASLVIGVPCYVGKCTIYYCNFKAQVGRRSWVRIPPESPVKFFHRYSEGTEHTVLYTRRCAGQNCESKFFCYSKHKNWLTGKQRYEIGPW